MPYGRYSQEREAFPRYAQYRQRRRVNVLELFDRIVNAIPEARRRYLSREISQLERILDDSHRL